MNTQVENTTQKMIEIEVQSLNDEILMGQCFLRTLGNRLQKELTSLNEEDDMLTDEVHIQSIANAIINRCHEIRESKAKREMLFVLTEIMNSETVSQ